ASATASASPTGTDVLSGISQDLQRDLAGLDTDTNSAIASKSQYYQQLMDLLEQTRKDLSAQSEKDGKELDPSTLLTLDRLKQDAQEGLKSVREVANRRGILDSGIALGMEQDVNKAYGQQETQVLSDRLSRIRDNLQTGLRQLSGQTIDIQGRKVADLSSLQDRFLQARQTARERAQQRQDSWQQYEMERSDRQAAQAAQNALRYSELTGSVVTPVSQADTMLAEAKRRYNAAKDAGDQAGMAAAAEMGRQARALGPTVDPGNTMSYDQLQGAIQGGQSVFSQVQQGAPTYQAAQAARKALQQASGPATPQPGTNGMSRQWDETSYTDVENWIGQARKNGLTAPEIAAALKRQGIDPWDFNIRH
ncbi:MAG: hypothetical protein M1602_01700, partial [Firmicutes bacterium]|nr:hypothetical protein [Bacillota bacterium]